VLLAIYTGFFLQYLCLGNRPIIIGEGARQLERIEEAIGSLILALWVMWGINWVPFFILVHLSCRKGKRWAQIVLTCWVVLAILGALGGIANAQHAPVAATSPILVPVVISLATGVILTYFVFLIGLWMPKSQAWMRARAIETKRNEDMFRRRFRI
jgi:glucose-6-phosphate-specific signal transduction histidine kinase